MANKFLFIICFSSFIFSQLLENRDNSTIELRNIVENASRLQQRVWVEDFTGLN